MDDIKVINDLGDERVKQEIDPHLQNILAKSHKVTRGGVISHSRQPSEPSSPT